MTRFWLCFLPLFVAVDAIGTLPLFMGLTEGIGRDRTRRVVARSVAAALVAAVAFIAGGKALLGYLGITIADFMVAGGVLLFVIAMSDLLTFEKRARQVDPDDLGAVPIGVPLLVGPAVLATALLLVDQHGLALTLAATVINILLAAVIFLSGGLIKSLLGTNGTKIVSKLASLVLAAIAVMMIRKGITTILQTLV